jgi:cold-inducible RNA-binding protein
MGKKLYIGNLPYSATDQLLSDTFSQVGKVESAKVVIERDTGRSKGFGFVEMSSDAEAVAAIEQFNGTNYEGRNIKVSEAKPMEPRAPGGDRGNSGGGFRAERGNSGGGYRN